MLLKNLIVICSLFSIILLFKYSEAVSSRYESENIQKQKDKDNKWRRIHFNEKILNDSLTESSSKERLQRLGYSTGFGSVGGYPGTGTGISTYSPVKLDLGGVVLGTLVGIGAILIIPKLLNAFTGNYGHYARSAENELSAVSDVVNKIDDLLSQNNIDSTNCMQRAICTYIRSTESNIKTGSADQVDDLIHGLVESSLVDYMLDGTAIKEAVENGKNVNAEDCDQIYSTCLLDTNTITNILLKILPPQKKSQQNL